MTIQTFLSSTVAATLITWLFGKAKTAPWYTALRAACGKFSLELGCVISKWGNTYLRALWEPIETVLVDWVLLMAEQLAVGLRKDNPEKMQEHLDRLISVGSEARADVVKNKLEAMATEGVDVELKTGV